jgi:hypothetical protein
MLYPIELRVHALEQNEPRQRPISMASSEGPGPAGRGGWQNNKVTRKFAADKPISLQAKALLRARHRPAFAAATAAPFLKLGDP